MAQRRMFSKDIVKSDAFLDMPVSSQLLYFQLGMEADDDGFIGNSKMIIRTAGANDDDMKILLTKRFLLQFNNGVIVIKHWKINNYIQKDRYNETKYLEEKNSLITKENGAYTERIQNVSSLETQVRLGKVRLGKVSIGKDRDTSDVKPSQDIPVVIDMFKVVNPSYKKWFGNKTQRAATERLIKYHGVEKLKKIIDQLPKSNNTDYMPVITTPVQLEDKMAQLAAAWQKLKNKGPLII